MALLKIAKRILSLTCFASSCEGIGACTHFFIAKITTALGLTKPRHWCTSTPIPNSSSRDRVQISCTGMIATFFFEDSDPENNGQEIESEGNDDNDNDDGGDDDDGILEAIGAQIGGANELGAQQAPNNNANGQNTDAFDWDGFSDEDAIQDVFCGNRSPMPSDRGICGIQASRKL
jgi:hypothetical protein